MERVHMELSIDQARAVGDELDLANRIHLGQFKEIAILASQGEIMVRDDRAPGGCRHANEDEMAQIESACHILAKAFGHHPSSSFGIGAQGVTLKARRGYEVKKALNQAVAKHHNPDGNSVHHTGVTVRYTQDEMPLARVEG